MKPNVSLCIEENEVHYNPWTDPRLIVKYTVENASNPIMLYTYESEEGTTGVTMFDKVEIDGTEVSITDLDTAQGMYQLSEGEHTVKYMLKNPTFIGDYTFSGCRGLTSITIPNSVTSIGESAFEDCSSLTSVTIPNSVTSIGDRAFFGCSGLTSVTIGNSVTSIGESAFYNCTGLTSVTIGNSVTSIGERAFSGCYGLTSVTIGNSVTSIGESAFDGCTGLTEITIPNSVTNIGDYAFNYCKGLTSVTIPNSVTSISRHAFYNCVGLTSIVIEATTPPNLSYNAFNNTNNCPIYVPSESVEAYKTASGWSDYTSRIQPITV